MLGKTLASPLNCKEVQPVHPKGDQSWVFIGRTDAEAEFPILWPPDVKNWLIKKHPGTGEDWRREKKGTTEDEMVGWHHQLNGHEFGIWCWTGKPSTLQSIDSQRLGHDWATELNWKLHLTDTSFSIEHHYLQIPYLQIHLHSHLFATPKTILEAFFPIVWRCRAVKKRISVAQHAWSQLRLKKELLCFLFFPLILYSSILPIFFFFFFF